MPEVINRVKAVLDPAGVEAGARKMSNVTERAAADMDRSLQRTTGVLGTFARAFGAAFSVGAVIKFTAGAVSAYGRQEQAIRQLEARIRSTGGASQLTSEELQKVATALQQVTTVGDEAIIELQGVLSTFTEIRGGEFIRATEAVLDLSTALGTDLRSAAIQVGKALNDPIKGITALSRSGVQFTEQQKEQIRVLVESGKVTEAQNIILDEFQTQMGGAARASAEGTGAIAQLSNSIGDVIEAFGQWFIEARVVQDILYALRLNADVLAGNTSVEDWAEASSVPLRVFAIVAKTVQNAIKQLGQEIGALFAILGQIEDFPAFLSRKLLGTGEATSIDAILDDLARNKERLQDELSDFIAAINGIPQGSDAQAPDDIISQTIEAARSRTGGPARRVSAGGGRRTGKSETEKANDQLKSFVESLEAQVRQLTLSEEAILRYDAAQATASASSQDLKDRANQLTDQLISLLRAEEERAEALARTNELQRKAAQLLAETITPQEELNATIADAQELLRESIITQEEYVRIVQKSAEDYNKAIDDIEGRTEERFREMEGITRRFGDQFLDIITGVTENSSKSWKEMVDSLIADIVRLSLRRGIVDPFVNAISGPLDSTVGNNPATSSSQSGLAGFGGFFSSLFGSLFGGFRQGGGPVMPGRAYVVGESGPETFIPNTAGTVAPGTGRTINIVNNFSVAGGGEVSQRSQAQISATLGRTINRTLART